MSAIVLAQTQRTDPRLLARMAVHYSAPQGFVGRNICYAVICENVYYGHIVAGSATRFLKGRNEFLQITIAQLNNVINNIFFSVRPHRDKYPMRNFTSRVVDLFCERAAADWKAFYGDDVIGFETLVEKPRTGELYLRSGFSQVGETIGYTCKRVGGVGSDSYGGRRVWNTDAAQLRPKIVLCRKVAK